MKKPHCRQQPGSTDPGCTDGDVHSDEQRVRPSPGLFEWSPDPATL